MEITGDRRHHPTVQSGWFRMKNRECRQHRSCPLTTPTKTERSFRIFSEMSHILKISRNQLHNKLEMKRSFESFEDIPTTSTEDVSPKKKMRIATINSDAYEKPSEFVAAIFEANGFSTEDAIKRATSKHVTPTPQMIEAYTMEISMAVREGDLKTLQRLHEAGADLDCCSRFGQHALHIACLRGHLDIVEFLINQAKVSVTVVDDMGRTPFHDACWSSSLNFEIIKLMIRIAPEEMLFPDKRGHTPFDYTRERDWEEWMKFLSTHQTLLTLEENV
jgi:ankyrin repeat protein